MTTYRVLRNADSGAVLLVRLKWCRGFWSRFRGLMLRSDLPEDEGLIFVLKIDTVIHMFFMAFPIAVIWLDETGRVVDKTLAKPWRPHYAPHATAQYTIEARPSLLDRVAVGDRLEFGQ